MYFVRIWEQTAFISLYSINWLVFITETECVYCAVRTGSLYRVSQEELPDFGRVFLMLKYTDITQNIYIQIWTVTEIMAREKCVLLAVPRTAIVQLTRYVYTKMRSQQS